MTVGRLSSVVRSLSWAAGHSGLALAYPEGMIGLSLGFQAQVLIEMSVRPACPP
jgi:hypothetical protein